MPRPMPIVVPGTGGMGSTSTNVGMNLQLDKIIPFIEAWNEKYVTEPARRESLLETLGMSPEEGEGLATEQMQKMAADNAQIRSAVETLKGITKKEERSRVAPTLTKPGVRDIAERWMREAGQPTTEQVDVPAIPGQTIDVFKSLLQADVTPTADILSRIGLIPGKEESQAREAIPTDIDDFVDRANKESIRVTGEPLTPGEQNKAALEFKRAQAKEISVNRLAQRNADAITAQKIKFNEEKGKQLAIIATAADVIEAKGEVSPQSKIDTAKKRMGGNLAKLANHYIDLDSTGAMLNVDKSTIANIFAAARASDVGQFLGRIAGTNEQSLRSSIKKIKPLLIQDIRQSTDMGARGLDSEKELEFYLQAATDEKTDIQSNIAAIVVLDEAFGNGEVAALLRELTDESLIKRISTEGDKILNRRKVQVGKQTSSGTEEGVITTKSGRKARLNAQGQYEYID